MKKTFQRPQPEGRVKFDNNRSKKILKMCFPMNEKSTKLSQISRYWNTPIFKKNIHSQKDKTRKILREKIYKRRKNRK